MTTSDAESYLDLYLAPLQPFLSRAEVTDIYINRPGELWIETLGGAIDRVEDDALDDNLLRQLAYQIASQSHQGISRRHPLLAASLPDGARVQIVSPPAPEPTWRSQSDGTRRRPWRWTSMARGVLS